MLIITLIRQQLTMLLVKRRQPRFILMIIFIRVLLGRLSLQKLSFEDCCVVITLLPPRLILLGRRFRVSKRGANSQPKLKQFLKVAAYNQETPRRHQKGSLNFRRVLLDSISVKSILKQTVLCCNPSWGDSQSYFFKTDIIDIQ